MVVVAVIVVKLQCIISVTKITQAGNDVPVNVSVRFKDSRNESDIILFIVQSLINEGRDNPKFRKSFGEFCHARGASNQVEKQDAVLGHTLLLQYLDSQSSRAA